MWQVPSPAKCRDYEVVPESGIGPFYSFWGRKDVVTPRSWSIMSWRRYFGAAKFSDFPLPVSPLLMEQWEPNEVVQCLPQCTERKHITKMHDWQVPVSDVMAWLGLEAVALAWLSRAQAWALHFQHATSVQEFVLADRSVHWCGCTPLPLWGQWGNWGLWTLGKQRQIWC